MIILNILEGGKWISFDNISQDRSYMKINCLRFGYISDTKEQAEKGSLKTAWGLYWSNLGEKKRFSEKQARKLFTFNYL